MFERYVQHLNQDDMKTITMVKYVYKDKVLCKICGEEISHEELNSGKCVAYIKKKQKDGSFFIDDVEHRKCTEEFWNKWRERQSEIAKEIGRRRNHRDGTATLFDFM